MFPFFSGTYAPKTILYTQFENWSELDGLETDCDGECGSEGWRLLGDDIDTGVGHGVVDVFLNVCFFYLQFFLVCYGLMKNHLSSS